MLVASVATLPAQRKFDEREIKATYLFNFAQFVDWPSGSFADPQAPLVIGIVDDEPLAAVLDAVVAGEQIKNRPLTVKRYRRVDDVTGCHILFISRSRASDYAPLLAPLQGRPILTVGDTDGFIGAGGLVRFLIEQNRLRLQINQTAARAAGMTISSRLLRVAEIVGAREGP
jgi:hypothetical protein